jgi:hypothetical protein
MPSDAQLAANHLNALKSTGPRTPEGKARSALNATKHGILAQVVLGAAEDDESFRALLDDLRRAFTPHDALDDQLVEVAAISYWRQRRVLQAELSGGLGWADGGLAYSAL